MSASSTLDQFVSVLSLSTAIAQPALRRREAMTL
jgi:hypothetical protein